MKQVHMEDPCKGCKRVADPANCEARRCAAWRKWFLYRWDLIRELYRNPQNGKGA